MIIRPPRVKVHRLDFLPQRAENSEKEMNNDTRTGLIAAAVAAAAVAGAGIYFIIRRRKNN